MADTVTLPKSEYRYLKAIKKRYDAIRDMLRADLFDQPPTRDANKIMREFQAAGLYNKEFLKSLSDGLKESSYFSQRSPKR